MRSGFYLPLVLAAVLSGVGLSGCAWRDGSNLPGSDAVDYSASFSNVATIGNGVVTLAISPETGRIIRFGLKDEANLLWVGPVPENALREGAVPGKWFNFGGDKIWALRQEYWGAAYDCYWPPVPALEGLPWRVTLDGNGALLESAPMAELGIRLTRQVHLPEEGSCCVIIRNEIEAFADGAFPVVNWAITQIVLPEYGLLDASPFAAPGSSERKLFVEIFERGAAQPLPDERAVLHTPVDSPDGAKTGCNGSWVAAVYPDGTALVQYLATSEEMPRSGDAVADAVAVEFFTCPTYAELETLGGEHRRLRSGEVLRSDVVWCVIPADGGRRMSPAEMAEKVRETVYEMKKVYEKWRSEKNF